ncbi:MFS transporter [Elioraea rosea]|uniref:MFS transporter n=1 Tax=Elioraea rosea TaxID=2492390 RepID=UPI001183577B|nr:MFS transporter [Elioraea rosea]
MTSPRAPVSRPLLLAGLGAAQIMGWGSTFYLPSVLGPPMGAELGLGQDVIFVGVTVMYLTGAVIAPPIGRAVDRLGARATMAAGTLVAAAALVLLALAEGLAGYITAWVALGLMLPMTLGQTGFAAIAQAVPGPAARRAMTLLTLTTGFTATVTWPATAALEAELGWRGTCLAFAAMHLAIALPLYLLVLPRGGAARADAARDAPPPAAIPRGRFVLLVLALGVPNAIGAGVSLSVIAMLAAFGHAPAGAIAIAALHGPAQVGARIIDLSLGARTTAMGTGLFSAVMLPLSFLPLAFGGTTTGASAFAVTFGIANGLMTVVRAQLPLELAGASGYGTLTGRLALPGNVMMALAPPLFAAILERGGIGAFVALAFALSLVALGALAALALARAREPRG